MSSSSNQRLDQDQLTGSGIYGVYSFRSLQASYLKFLRRQLDGHLPPSFEVKCPLVHSRVSIPIPNEGEDFESLSRDFILDACSNALDHSFAWKTVIEMPVVNGRRLELCWKRDTNLDWIWLRDDVNGNKREWEVLYGLAMQTVSNSRYHVT